MIKWDLFQRCKNGSTSANQSMWYTTLTKWRLKIMWSSQQMQKSIWQIWLPFTIKIFNKVNIEEIYFNTIKVIYNKSILFTNHIQGWKANSFSLNIRNKTRLFTISLLFNIVLEVLARAIRKENEIKGIQIGKEEVNCDYLWMTWFYIQKNPKDYTKKLLGRVNKFSKVAGYNTNMQKSLVFMHTIRKRN